MAARSRFRLRLGVGVLAVAGALLLAGCSGAPDPPVAARTTGAAAGEAGAGTGTSSASASASSAATPGGPYVALGDSYTAGPAIPNQVGDPPGCERSSNDYPALLAQGLGLGADEVTNASCSGATIADLSAAQSTGNGTNPAQLSALSADTGLVTVGIGGNDVDFTSVLTRCVELDLPESAIGGAAAQLSPCRAYYTSGGSDQIQQKIQAAAGPLASALAQVIQLAPRARVYVVGYPALLPATGTTCAHSVGLTSGDVAFLNSDELQLNSMLRQTAQAAGATYVDTYTPSVGHDACSDAATRWIEPLVPTAPADPLHPNERGEQGMADAILGAIEGGAPGSGG